MGENKIKGFDIDGVIHLGKYGRGIMPGPGDVIITGRSHEESPETLHFLRQNGINNIVFFNPCKFDDKTRITSGIHKANILWNLSDMGVSVEIFFEDDPIQLKEIKNRCPWIKAIHVDHGLIEKENVRHTEDLED